MAADPNHAQSQSDRAHPMWKSSWARGLHGEIFHGPTGQVYEVCATV